MRARDSIILESYMYSAWQSVITRVLKLKISRYVPACTTLDMINYYYIIALSNFKRSLAAVNPSNLKKSV